MSTMINNMKVTNLEFHLTSEKDDSYQLNLQFHHYGKDRMGTYTADETRTFSFYRVKKPIPGSELFDIYSQNGKSTENPDDLIASLFKKVDFEGIDAACKQLPKRDALKNPTLIVLDLQNPITNPSYGSPPKAAKRSEEIFLSFLQKTTPSYSKMESSPIEDQIHHCLREHQLPDFVLNEGSLKHDIIDHGGLSKNEQTYLLKNGIFFCQVAEFFIRAFELGFEAKSSNFTFQAENYIRSIHGKTFHPCEKSTVFYQHLYKKGYSKNGPFMKAISESRLFDLTHSLEEGVTKASLQKRKTI